MARFIGPLAMPSPDHLRVHMLDTAFGVQRSRRTVRNTSCDGGAIARSPSMPDSRVQSSGSVPSTEVNVFQSRNAVWTSAYRESSEVADLVVIHGRVLPEPLVGRVRIGADLRLLTRGVPHPRPTLRASSDTPSTKRWDGVPIAAVPS
jgi:hypothetical protein